MYVGQRVIANYDGEFVLGTIMDVKFMKLYFLDRYTNTAKIEEAPDEILLLTDGMGVILERVLQQYTTGFPELASDFLEMTAATYFAAQNATL